MSESTVNVPLLRKAVEWAEVEAARPKHLSRWNQGAWVSSPLDIERDQSCGTCYCIAGFVMSQESDLAPSDEIWSIIVDGAAVDEEQFRDSASEMLGIGFDAATKLFDARNTIEDVRRIAESIAGEAL